MARRLASQANIDIIGALGPWVVEDLLAAGCTKPIVALYRADPNREGLIGSDGRPIVSNLTVDATPSRLREDLLALTATVPVKKLGVLYFASGEEKPKIMAAIDSVAKAQGIEVVTADGYNAYGTFAFFKAHGSLGTKVDAVYAPFLWGMESDKPREFFERLISESVPVYSSEGRYSVEHGALLSRANITLDARAWFDAWKTFRIIKGEKPADLPTSYPESPTFMVNEATLHRLKLDIRDDLLTEAETIAAPVPPEAPRYSLADAVRRAFDQNAGHLASQEAIAGAAAAASRAWSDYLPQVNGALSAYHFDDHTVINEFEETKNNRLFGSITLDQALFSPGIIRSIQIESQKRKLAQAGYEQDSLDLALAVTSAYLDNLKAAENLSAVTQYRRAVTYALEMARTGATISGKESPAVDRLRSEQLLASARMLEARRTQRAARVLLNALMNQPGETQFELDTVIFTGQEYAREQQMLWTLMNSASRLSAVRDYLVAQGLAGSPRLRSAQLQVELRHTGMARNRARYLPSLSFKSAFNYTDRLRDYPPAFVEKDFSWYAGLDLKLPIFLGGDRIKERRQLKAEMSQMEYARDQASVDLMRDVSVEVDRLMTSLRQSDLLSEALGLQNPQLESAVGEFVAGKTGYLEALDAVRSGYDISKRSIDARYAYLLSTATLAHAVGWVSTDEYPTPGLLIANRLARAGLIRR
jgi:outer membrane protein TolC/ABC-type uncharacterized transport system substrate-binding protein